VNQILEARLLAPDVKYFRVAAPKVARKRQAGQFVIVRVVEEGERIPLTIADSGDGWIALIVQGVGKTTTLLNRLEVGDRLLDLAGPLGVPSEVDSFGTVVVVGGGVGTAIAYPTAVAMKRARNRVISIIGGRSRPHVILEEELAATSDEVYACTDDGSYGFAGLVTDKLSEVIAVEPVDRVLAIGPIPMMAAVAEVTRPDAIPTIVSLNPIMVDGTGMCGGCRVQVGGESRFACVDGPEFDAHQVDFDLLAKRNTAYEAWEHFRRLESTPS
jgi:ferredoxin--NADP+ reductase